MNVEPRLLNILTLLELKVDKVQYLCFNGNEFTNFISFVKLMNSRDKSKGTGSVLLSIDGDKLVCKAIDNVSNYIEYSVELYKSDNMITEPLVIPINDLAALIKCSYSDKLTIRKYFNQYEFNVIGNGWLPFKTAEIDQSKFNITGNETEIGTINSVKLRNAISSVLGYTQDYTYARDKYIKFSKDQMTVTSRLSSVITKDEFVEMTLHRDDASMIRSLLKDNFDLSVYKVESAVERLMFIGPKFRLVLVAAEVDFCNIKYIDGIKDYITIDCNELYKLVAFSEEYSASKHIIGISIKEDKVQINIKNVLAAKHISVINSKAIGNVADISKEIEVSAHNLLKSLKLFQDKRSREINIYITDELIKKQSSMVLFDDSTQAIINIYNR